MPCQESRRLGGGQLPWLLDQSRDGTPGTVLHARQHNLKYLTFLPKRAQILLLGTRIYLLTWWMTSSEIKVPKKISDVSYLDHPPKTPGWRSKKTLHIWGWEGSIHLFRLWNMAFLLLQVIVLREGTGYLSTSKNCCLKGTIIFTEEYSTLHKQNVIPKLCRDLHGTEPLTVQSPLK